MIQRDDWDDRPPNVDRHPPLSGLTRRTLLVRGGGVMCAVGLADLLIACAGGDETSTGAPTFSSPEGGGRPVDELTWALFADPVALDYAFAYDYSTNPVVTNVVDTLVRFNPAGELVPNLATEWETTDDTTYVYSLRDDVVFHDGSSLTAADAAASMQRLLDPKVASYLAGFVANVQSIEATGSHELTVRLKRPDATWRYVPGTMAGAVVPKAFLDEHADAIGSPSAGLPGSGPYKFASWDKGQQVVLEANQDYWNKDRQPRVQTLVFTIVKEEQSVVAALGNGSIDGVFNLSGPNLSVARERGQVGVGVAPSYNVHYVGLNVTRKPWNDPRVCQALSMAIDKEGILASAWGGEGQMSKSPAPVSLAGYSKPVFREAYESLPAFSHNVERAKELIREAGAEGAPATLLVSGTAVDRQEAIPVQEAGTEIGLDISLETITDDQLLSRIAAEEKDYDGFIAEWAADYPDPLGTLAQCFLSDSPTNYSAFKDVGVDSDLRAAQTTINDDERAQAVVRAQARIVEPQPWIVLYSPYTNMVLSGGIGGYELRPLWFWDSWAADLSGS